MSKLFPEEIMTVSVEQLILDNLESNQQLTNPVNGIYSADTTITNTLLTRQRQKQKRIL